MKFKWKMDFRGGKRGWWGGPPFDRPLDATLRVQGPEGDKRSLAPTVRARNALPLGNGGGSRNPEWRVTRGMAVDFSQGMGWF